MILAPEHPNIRLENTDEQGFHFVFDFSGEPGQPITSITLHADPAAPTNGATNCQATVDVSKKSGLITEGLKPYTEYRTFIVVTRGQGQSKTYETGTARTWPKGKN